MANFPESDSGCSNFESKKVKNNEKEDEESKLPEPKTTISSASAIFNLKSSYSKNQLARLKFGDDPEKFLPSELQLHDDIQTMKEVLEQEDFYEKFLSNQAIQTIASLLNHDNNDIASAVLEFLKDSLDVDPAISKSETFTSYLTTLLSNNTLFLVKSAIEKFDLSIEEESHGVYTSLEFFEFLFELKSDLIEDPNFNGPVIELIDLLFKMLKKQRPFDQIRLYITEILSILLPHNIAKQHCSKKKYIYTVLLRLAYYKSNQPSDSSELEYMENLFTIICLLIVHIPNKLEFFESEGIQLMVLMLKSQNKSVIGALRTLNYSFSGKDSGQLCEKFIEISGLRYLFPYFMIYPTKYSKMISQDDYEDCLCSIIALLFENADGSYITRLICKFTENTGEKSERIVELLKKYLKKIGKLRSINLVKKANEELALLNLYNGGLAALQNASKVIWFLLSLSKESCTLLQSLMKRQGIKLSDIKEVIVAFGK